MSQTLRDAALAVRENAHAPYSKFKVGAAIRTSDGSVFVGCNVENVAYPEGTCAEAGAIAAMCAAGQRQVAEVYVVAGSPSPVPPCGGCRQKLAEFSTGDVVVTLATVAGEETRMRVDELLPGAFDPGHMA
ncbi:MAG: cytidine deaminase [Pseudomonadota bacterium]